MSNLQQIQIDLGGIGKGIADGDLAVPLYQRSYAWRVENANELFQDVGTAIAEKEPEYFLGSIILIRGADARREVVDGQQRLATTMILIAAIRDYFLTKGDKNRADDLERDYLGTRDLKTQEWTPKLRLNELDHDYFTKRILSRPDSTDRAVEATRDSHRRLDAGARAAAEHIGALAKTRSNPTEHLVDWVIYFKTHVRVIWVRVPDDTNAFTIFETLNDRGLELAISDLLKNYLFHRAEDRIGEVQHRWIAMHGTLEAVEDETIVVPFVRHLWSSMHGITREKELYNRIKNTISSKQAAVDLAGTLKNGARTYAAILNTNDELWTTYGHTARSHMVTLNLLGMVQMRPLLLAILDKFAVPEVRASLRVLVSWAVRFLITGGLGGGTLEGHYSAQAVNVRDGAIKGAKGLANAMGDVVPSDSEFRKQAEVITVSKSHLARYYLQALERQARGESQPELVPNPNEEEINLEHILPQNPGTTGWGHIPVEIARASARRLGNLVLLREAANNAAGNASFAQKKPTFAASEFKLTSMVAKHSGWGLAEIEERQKHLANLAIKTWPAKP
jgi:hypothetical protein